MKIIIGLGNPGKKYENTRHNVGFLFLDKIFNLQFSIFKKIQDFRLEKKFNAEIAKFRLGEEEVLLVRPQTFMNLSGEAIKKIVDFYKLNPARDIIIVHDDIDLPLGAIRIRFRGSSAGHKGIQSIIDNLGTEGFMRVRIGVGRPEDARIKVEDWVLQKFTKEELAIVGKVFDDLIKQGMRYLVN